MRIPQPALRHQDLIVTLYGMYARPPHEVLPVSSLITLMGDLGFDAQGVRSAISRLKAKGILVSTRKGGVAAYGLDPSMSDVISDGDERIFSGTRPESDGKWVLVTFSVPESKRALRHQIRASLSRLGFGNVGQGLWIAPAANLHEAQTALDRKGLSEYVDFFVGAHVDGLLLADKVAQWWDLEAINRRFDDFLHCYSTIAEEWAPRFAAVDSARREHHAQDETGHAGSDIERDAFRVYAPLLTMWRELPYAAPPLPLDVVPDDWNGPRARAAFIAAHELFSDRAAAYVDRVLARV